MYIQISYLIIEQHIIFETNSGNGQVHSVTLK